MGIEENTFFFNSAAQNLNIDQAQKLQAKLQAVPPSSRYVTIDIKNGKCNLDAVREVDILASAVEDAKRALGLASDNIFERETCTNLLNQQIIKIQQKKIHKAHTEKIDPNITDTNLKPNAGERGSVHKRPKIAEELTEIEMENLIAVYIDLINKSDENNIINIDKVREIIEKLKEKYESINHKILLGEAVIELPKGKTWEVKLLPGSIQVRERNSKEHLSPNIDDVRVSNLDENADSRQSVSEETSPHSESTQNKTNAAVRIQKVMRGHLDRKAFLPQSLYPEYKKLYEKLNNSEDQMPEVEEGNLTVYLPNEMPNIILKQTGNKDEDIIDNTVGADRFQQMFEIRKILRSQKSTHLIIPEARRYKEFLIEKRLPINVSEYYNMKIYSTEPELFDDAVREMTRLFSKVYIDDLVSSSKTILNSIVGDIIRYDNLPLYIEEEEGKRVGKIGLIDLEYSNVKNDESLGSQELKTLARIFPLHMNIIKEEAQKLGVKSLDPSVINEQIKGLKYIQEGYTQYHNWLTEKITTTNSVYQIEVSSERLNNTKKAVAEEILLLNKGVNKFYERRQYKRPPPENFLKGDPEETAKKIADELTHQILECINKIISEINKNKPTNSETEKMVAGTILFTSLEDSVLQYSNKNRNNSIKNLLNEHIIKNTNDRDLERNLIHNIICNIMDNLEGKEIFSFNPDFKISRHWMSLRF